MADPFSGMATEQTTVLGALSELYSLLADPSATDPLHRVALWRVGPGAYDAIRSLTRRNDRPSTAFTATVEQNPFVPPRMALGFAKDGTLLAMVRDTDG